MPLVIAHRGASAEAPENTIPAIKRAWKRMSDGVEIDVHLTLDRRLAVIHDADTGRVAKVALPVERSTLAQLQTLDVGVWKKKRYVGRRVPELSQALASIRDGRWAFVELKSGPAIAPALVGAIESSALDPAQVMVCSFKIDTLAAVRDERERRGLDRGQLGWICGLADVESLRDPAERETLFWRAESAGCTWLSLHHSKQIDLLFMNEAHERGFRVSCWTVDKPQEAARLARVGVDAVITNDPKKVGPYARPESVAPIAAPTNEPITVGVAAQGVAAHETHSALPRGGVNGASVAASGAHDEPVRVSV